MEEILIGLGSNLGDSISVCKHAIKTLSMHPQIRILRISSLYRTEPVGMVDQSWFVNGVVQGETSLSPTELLDYLLQVEKDFGRVREIKWGPRTLDLDILSFGNRQIALPRLTIPHPRVHERLFVLIPMVEIVPNWVHPGIDLPAQEILDRLSTCTHEKVERI